MARYIKANPKVAQFLRVENDRNQVKDGNYLLWQADILPLGRLTDLPQILEQIGGIALMAHEARQEQDGTVVRELPTATDPRFVVEKDETTAEDEANNTEVAEEPAEQPTEGAAESEESSEAMEEPAEPAGDETAASESETPNTETV
ncbi:MAG: hypothetical protein WCS15_05185 [Prevotella sp.]